MTGNYFIQSGLEKIRGRTSGAICKQVAEARPFTAARFNKRAS
jgi:hypothetical protein